MSILKKGTFLSINGLYPREFLDIAAKGGIKTEVEVFPFDELPEALILAKGGKVNGNPVVRLEAMPSRRCVFQRLNYESSVTESALALQSLPNLG